MFLSGSGCPWVPGLWQSGQVTTVAWPDASGWKVRPGATMDPASSARIPHGERSATGRLPRRTRVASPLAAMTAALTTRDAYWHGATQVRPARQRHLPQQRASCQGQVSRGSRSWRSAAAAAGLALTSTGRVRLGLQRIRPARNRSQPLKQHSVSPAPVTCMSRSKRGWWLQHRGLRRADSTRGA
jgi:hypothetical protein